MDNEKIIVKSESYNIKIYFRILTVLLILWFLSLLTLWGYTPSTIAGYIRDNDFADLPDFVFPAVFIYVILAVIPYLLYAKNEITVTDRRVYGKCTWGRLVELPLDQISAIAMGGIKGVAVATASGMVKFSFIRNREEVFNAVSALLKQRQDAPAPAAPAPVVQNVQQSTNADEIAKYKQLLDSGAITQEEYDAKKKQLLGL